MPLMAEIQMCPQCECPLNRENVVVVPCENHIKIWLYCEFCNKGWEIERWPDGYFLKLDYQARTEPANFARFMERFTKARLEACA